MLLKEVNNLTNIRLTESDIEGIWLHFESGGKKAGVALSALLDRGFKGNATIEAWAREQLDKE